MIGLSILLALQSAGGVPSDISEAQRISRPDQNEASKPVSLVLPDIIAPALAKYMSCLLGKQGRRSSSSEQGSEAGIAHPKVFCETERRLSKSSALRLLSQKNFLDESRRDAFVETHLSGIERFVDPKAKSMIGAHDSNSNRSQMPKPVAVTEEDVPVGKPLEIPDAIAPAVVPYLICLQSAAGMPISINGELQFSPPKAEGCGAVRAQSARDARALLRARKVRSDAEEQSKFIEDTLVSIENFVALPSADFRGNGQQNQ